MTSRANNLIGPSIWTFESPDSWLAHVKSLVIRTESKASKVVPEITLTFGKRIVVRVNRDDKHVTTDELKLLSQEYDKPYPELFALFNKRKIKIFEFGVQVNGTQDAKCKRRKRKDSGPDQFVQSRPAPDMLEEKPLCFES